LTGALVFDCRNGPQHVGNSCISVALQADKLIFIASIAAVKRANDTPSLFEQDTGALLEADDALEDDDDEFEEITESDYVY